MSQQSVYGLNGSIVIEPLVDRWVAWSHLISPVPASLHLLNYQIKILKSYLEDPKVHVKVCQNAKFRSGRFVDIPEERAPEVERLLANAESRRSENIKLAKSLTEFHNLIVHQATGQALEPYYRQIPEELRGYVELVYDYYNRPTVRVYESLLYESCYYDKSMQSLRIFQQARDGLRPFFMNTPRLVNEGEVNWETPFEDPRLDEFFKLDCFPRPLGYIRELFGPGQVEDQRLQSLLSQVIGTPDRQWAGPGARIRYFGHACALVEWNGISVLIDPNIAAATSEGGVERLTYQDLPNRIDYALVTHNHHDHFCLESLLRLRHRIGCLVLPRPFGICYGDISLKLMARKLGFKEVIEIDALESISLPNGEIIAVPFMGEHADLAHGKTGYVIRAGNEKILFAADSDCLDRRLYDHLHDFMGAIQTVFIGLECVGAPLSWSCGPLLPRKPDFNQEHSRRYKGCDSARAFSILEAVGAQRLYIYAMGLEPWLEYMLGLALSAESPQIQESKKLLTEAHEQGFEEAKLLFGKAEIHLPDLSGRDRSRIALFPEKEDQEIATARSAVNADRPEGSETTPFLQDEFIFS